jgi:DNA-directed RNA polymerase specialized sigma subunit
MLTTQGRVGSCETISGVDGLDSASPVNTTDTVLSSLSRLEKLILTLTYHEGLTLRETGTVLGLSEQEVRKTLASIERRFARALDEERAALEMA